MKDGSRTAIVKSVICQEVMKKMIRQMRMKVRDLIIMASCVETADSIFDVSASSLEMRSPVFL